MNKQIKWQSDLLYFNWNPKQLHPPVLFFDKAPQCATWGLNVHSLRCGQQRWQEGGYERGIRSTKMEAEMDCGTVQFPKLWWFLLLHLSSGGGGGGGEGGGGRSGGGGRPLASPYIINGIVSMTLLTKQMHKSHRSESIDTETFNHVLNNDHCSHNAIIISRLRLGWAALSLAWQATASD